MVNLVFKFFNGDWKKIALLIKESKNQQLLLELIKKDYTEGKFLNSIQQKNWKDICINLEEILNSVSLENQKKILALLLAQDLFFMNWSSFDFFYSGYQVGFSNGYNSGYQDSEDKKENKIEKKKKDLVPIRITEKLTNERIQNWIIGNYDSLEEAQADCKYTSQTEAYLNLIAGRNVFLTGPAGSGKSFVIDQYANMLTALDPNIDIIRTSTTGVSATNINGITIHSFLGCHFKDYNRPYNDVKEEYSIHSKERWRRGDKKLKNADVVIIDEISMMSKSFFNFFTERYKDVKSKAQIIVCGDFSQLPPVATQEDIKEFGNEISEFCFDSEGWKELELKVCYLDKLYRTKDKRLAFILNEISLGRGNTSEVISELKKLPQTQSEYNKGSALLLSSNVNVDKINQEQQDKNLNEINIYNPTIREDLVTLNIDKEEKIKRCEEFMIKNKHDSPLILKEDDTIMITSNLYERDLYEESEGNSLVLANGTIGTFVYDPNHEYKFGIKLKNKSVFFIPPKIASISYMTYDEQMLPKSVTEAAYEYIPMKLAYAITIHKSQGQSFSDVTCDLTSTFMKGLGYVALSRAQSYDGITLLNKYKKAIPFNEKALSIGEQSLDVKVKTQEQALKNRKSSSIILQEVLKDPIHYMRSNFVRKGKK